ncbi:MAG: translation initiation factor IF-2, partial [Gramella sp.]|nr:translation initiation factor IF-2 [Christiangramia sp.]
MAEAKTTRLNKVLREFNISLDRAVEFLNSKGYEIDARPTTKISGEIYEVLSDEFETDKTKKRASKEVGEERKKEKEELRKEIEEKRKAEEEKKEKEEEVISSRAKLEGPKTVGKIDLDKKPGEKPVQEEEATPKEEAKETPAEEPVQEAEETKQPEKPAAKAEEKVEEPKKEEKKPEPKKVEAKKEEAKKEAPKKEEPKKEEAKKEEAAPAETEEAKEESSTIETKYTKLSGPNFTGKKIDLSQFKKPVKKKDEKKDDKKDDKDKRKKRRRRISKDVKGGGGAPRVKGTGAAAGRKRSKPITKEEPTAEEVQKQVRETLEKLQGKSSKGKGAKYRRQKRD